VASAPAKVVRAVVAAGRAEEGADGGSLSFTQRAVAIGVLVEGKNLQAVVDESVDAEGHRRFRIF
jgi:hypothetical protein